MTARLVSGEGALPGARVRALRDLGVGEKQREYLAAADGGEAVLTLPPGTYYLTAASEDGSFFGYYGPNPVQVVSGGELFVSIRGVEGNGPPERVRRGGASAVEGTVTTGDRPLAGAAVAFYLDASTQFRGPAWMELETDGEGRFAGSLSPGRYFVVVRRCAAGGGSYGPLAVGDHFGYWAHNPLRLHGGETVALRVAAVEVLRRTGWSGSSPLRTRVSGTVRTPEGSPLAGFRVFLHAGPEMLGKPAFVSEVTGADGRYEIWAERAGTFHLGARRAIGQAREEGEVLGLYEGAGGNAVRVRLEGEALEGLDVVVREGGGTR